MKKYLLILSTVLALVFILGASSLAKDAASASSGMDINIPAGDDQFRVVDAGFDVQLPADFFEPGSKLFEGTIICGGGDDGSVDTTIKRLEDITLPPPPSEDIIPIEIVELNLVSCQPITVEIGGGDQLQRPWSVNVNLSPTTPPPGQMTIRRTHENGGTFDSALPVQLRFTFTPVDDSQEDAGSIDEIIPVAPGFEFPYDPTDPRSIIGRPYEIIPPAFDFNAHDIPWVKCPEVDSDFCPKLLIYSAENSWVNFEPVVNPELEMPEPDTCKIREGGSVFVGPGSDGLITCERDNCPLIANPDQSDSDEDGLGDACDACPDDPDNDADNDGMCGDADNCPLENPQGLDADSDGCTDTIEGLYDNLQNTEIHSGVKNSLLTKVNNALSSLTTKRVNAAINKLGAFINQVEAQAGKKISQKDAAVLTNFAQNVIQANSGNQPQSACIQPPSGIIGWWSGDGTPNDLINGNDAVLHDDAGFTSGKVGSAFSFDGIGDYASIPYSSDLDPSEITVEFWVSGPQMNQQPGNTGSGVTLIENSAANHEGWHVGVTPGGGIGVKIGDGTQWHPIISPVGLYHPASGWRHVALTYDGTSMHLYLDAVPQFGWAGKPVNNAQLSTGRDINIGTSWNGGSFARFFKGRIDEVEIYDRALSVSEIQAIYNAGSSGKCKPNVCVAAPSELVGWWTMDDAAGSSVANDRAGGNDGIVNGATMGVLGKVATAADFDGTNDYIEVPNNAALNMTDAITIDAWVKLDSLPGGRLEIAEKAFLPWVGGYSFSIFPTGELWFRSSQNLALSSNTQLSLNTWHHIAVTFEANNALTFYIDGQIDTSIYAPSWFPPIVSTTAPLRIGRFFDGAIDELEIFDRALSPFEIWSIYNAGTAGKCKPLTPMPPGQEVE